MTPSDWWYAPAFLANYEYIGDDGQEFSGSSSSSAFDQKDTIRYLLADPAELDDFSGADTVNSVLVSSVGYRVSISDVVAASFSEESDGEVQFVSHQGVSSSSASIAQLPESLAAAGDVVINYLDPNHDDLEPGQYGFWLHLHELGHAVGGLDDFQSGDPAAYDSQKYSMMSYNTYGGVYASGLGLLDIAALQDTYDSTNTSTRSGNTTYSLGNGLGFYGATANDAFLYTIWDGGGTDTIDASGFNVAAQIDLRAGYFSSIGKDASGNAWSMDGTGPESDPGNVAIAYGTVIENAIGTAYADSIIGNAAANVLTGGAGNDTLNGGSGNDTLYGDAGADILIGGGGEDYLYSGDGDDIVDYYRDSASTYNFADAGAGFDYFQLSGSWYLPSAISLHESGTIYTLGGEVNSVEGVKVTSTASNVPYVLFESLGWTIDFDVAREVAADYSQIDEALIIDIGPSSWQGTGQTSEVIDYYVDPATFSTKSVAHFIGSNYGDEINFDYGWVARLHLGSGNDVVNVTSTNRLDVNYIGGNDVINGAYYLLDLQMNGDITVSDISFTELSRTLVSATSTTRTYSADFRIDVDGKGSILLNSGRLIQTTGADLIFNTGDDIINYGPDIYLSDGRINYIYGNGSLNATYQSYGTLATQNDDTLFGASGNDTIWSMSGDDVIWGGAGNDNLDGKGGDDVIHREDGGDTVYGDLGNDILMGGGGNDNMSGASGSDILNGEDGDDELQGGSGDDTLQGAAGNDRLHGDQGFDVAVFVG